LEAQGLVRVFGAGHTQVRAVDGVDLRCDAGELVLVMGPSGSGKTTLLTMIGAMLRPTSGRIVIDGLDVTALPDRALPRVRRELVGFVFQSFNLLEALSAEENVQIALDLAGTPAPEARRRARELLVEAGLADRLGFRARDLSAGEKQRVSIARAIANRPRLILADEPTASLDSRAGAVVMDLLRELTHRERRAAVVVSHDTRLEAVADRVLWMEDGRLEVAHAPGSGARPPTGRRDTPLTVRRPGRDPRTDQGEGR
jgi:putative ABC transport system ATP-binding protein